MSIFDMFRGGANPNAIQKNAGVGDPMNPANPNLPQNHNMQPHNGTTHNGQQQGQQTQVDPNNPQANNPNPNNPQSPEADYSKLWVNDPNNKGPADPAAFSFNIDANKVGETFNQLDFTKAVTPELLAKISAGGQDAISATLAAMNTIAQQAVKTAVIASTKVTENGISASGQRMKDYIPGLVREHAVSNVLREDNPLMSKPEYAPMVEAVTLQMARQFPQATPDEIKKHTSKYFDEMTSTLVKHSGKTISDAPVQTSQARVQTDWSSEPI